MCLVYFHCRSRVLNHVKYRSIVCRTNLLFQEPILTVADANELSIKDRPANRGLAAKGLRAHSAIDPCFRLPGPIPAPVFDLAFCGKKVSKHHVLGRMNGW